jgi:hypothetical protein
VPLKKIIAPKLKKNETLERIYFSVTRRKEINPLSERTEHKKHEKQILTGSTYEQTNGACCRKFD